MLKLLKLFLSITTEELQSLEPPKIYISLYYWEYLDLRNVQSQTVLMQSL